MFAVSVVWFSAALSGAAALAYEICWSRALVIPLGNALDAAAVVLAGFMLGLAAGARFGGELGERGPNPLFSYAVLEGLLGLYALVAPALLGELSQLSPKAGLSPAVGTGLRYGAALVLIAAPGIAMGASLPLLVRAVTSQRESLRTRISLTYGFNTAGAACGASLAGFWGIASLGVRSCSACAGLLSGLAALMALGLGRVSRRTSGPKVRSQQSQRPVPTRLRRLALAAAFVSGFVMLAFELLWARTLTFVFGHDTYAFASLLVFVLTGLALGGLLHRALARAHQSGLLAALLALLSVTSLASFWVAAGLVVKHGRDPFGLSAVAQLSASLFLEWLRELVYTPLLVLLPSVCAGALFPTACSVYAGDAADTARKVSVVALANGVGSALGALFAAAFLVELFGIQGSLVALSGVVSVISAAVAMHASVGARARPAWILLPIAATLGLSSLLPSSLPRKMLMRVVGERHQKLLYYEEARTGTVSVIENKINGERQLLMNAANEVTTRLVHDQSFKFLGHLGPLLHPAPKDAVIICLGAGLAAGAAATHPLERLFVVDLSRAVENGARYFEKYNNGVLRDPRFELRIGDGRRFLLDSPRKFDLAIIDSTHPKSVDSWVLYTKQFYELVRRSLNPGGIAVQWLPLHGLSESEFKIIVRTFLSAFPEMTLWANAGFETYGQVGYAKLVGVRGAALEIDVEQLTRRLKAPRVKADLSRFGMDQPQSLLDLYVASAPVLDEWTQGLPIQVDDRPIVSYLTRFARGRPMLPALLLAVRSPVTPLMKAGREADALLSDLTRSREAQGLVLDGDLPQAFRLYPQNKKVQLYAEQSESSLPYYEALAELYADDADRLFEAATQLSSLGHARRALRLYEQALGMRPGDFRLRLNQALSFLQLGDSERAVQELDRLRNEQPRSALVHFNLGAAVLAAGEASVAAAHLEQAKNWDQRAYATRLALAKAYLRSGKPRRAEAEYRELLRENPWISEAQFGLGQARAALGKRTEAIRALCRAMRMEPNSDLPERELSRLGAEPSVCGRLTAR